MLLFYHYKGISKADNMSTANLIQVKKINFVFSHSVPSQLIFKYSNILELSDKSDGPYILMKSLN